MVLRPVSSVGGGGGGFTSFISWSPRFLAGSSLVVRREVVYLELLLEVLPEMEMNGRSPHHLGTGILVEGKKAPTITMKGQT